MAILNLVGVMILWTIVLIAGSYLLVDMVYDWFFRK